MKMLTMSNDSIYVKYKTAILENSLALSNKSDDKQSCYDKQ